MADVTPPEGRASAYGLIGAAFSGGFVLGPLHRRRARRDFAARAVLVRRGDQRRRLPLRPVGAAGIAGAGKAHGVLLEARQSVRRDDAAALAPRALGPRRWSTSCSTSPTTSFRRSSCSMRATATAGRRWQVGLLLALVGVLDMIVQGLLVGPVVKRFGDRATMIFGLFGGALGIACMGLAPTGLLFALAMVPNALWGLAMPTLQSLMTQRVSESEQGQLQGANMSVASIAGVASPLFFGWVYGYTVQPGWSIDWSGSAFLISSGVLLLAAFIGWRVARQASREEQSMAHRPADATAGE